MSASNSYVPSLQPVLNYAGGVIYPGTPFSKEYLKHILLYGLPPPNYKVLGNRERHRGKTRERVPYYEEKNGATPTTDSHPCSPAARQVKAPIQDEQLYGRKQIIGTYHPPLPTYKAGQFCFEKHENWESAAAKILATEFNLKYNGALVTEQWVRRVHSELEKKALKDSAYKVNTTLYHQDDRRTVVFKGEPQMARLFRHVGYGLAVLCPVLPANGTNFEHIYNTVNRPPVRWRHSVGEQCRYKFGCVAALPVRGEGKTKEAFWLTITPTKPFKSTWDSVMRQNRDFAQLRPMIGWPETLSTEQLLWTLVTAHRTVVNGLLPASTNLGDWVQQYGKYVVRDPQRRGDFEYKPNLAYKGARLRVLDLGSYILNSNATLKYVRLWEDANDAHLAWLLDRTLEKELEYQERLEAAGTLPE